MSPIPSLDYNLLYQERVIRSVANNTREDGEDFCASPPKFPFIPACSSSRCAKPIGR